MTSTYAAALALDRTRSALESVSEKAGHLLERGPLRLGGGRFLVRLVRVRRELRRCHRTLSRMEARTEEDRARMGEIARIAAELASRLEAGVPTAGLDGALSHSTIARQLESLTTEAEDFAETAALGASAEFARLVERELEGRLASGPSG